MTLPPIPKDRNWSPETWRAGLDEAVRLGDHVSHVQSLERILETIPAIARDYAIAHATTLLDAGIVKPVLSEAKDVLHKLWHAKNDEEGLAVIQSALDKARAAQTWSTGAKQWPSGKDYADGCKKLADDFFNEARKAGRI